jgi:hypothetical protein
MTYNQAPDVCDECAGGVDEADLAPSCGAHRLHQWCAPWFRCRECEYVRVEVCS